jgi:hypothetical protein
VLLKNIIGVGDNELSIPGEKLDHARTSMIENLRMAVAEAPQSCRFFRVE